ncbi:MAG: hypothetical protein BJ554DRAFT_2853 [Olpidium bornovanus]|uniref:Uncharacterized protein n=1 Tax=Olpidium bornovanus TaxID=278681 RepID=A0A8H7ZPV9_9FUNG|nr:MAG: hypothetical protein BJ554DRAFT_2853 [Olpidium bornovanus]
MRPSTVETRRRTRRRAGETTAGQYDTLDHPGSHGVKKEEAGRVPQNPVPNSATGQQGDGGRSLTAQIRKRALHVVASSSPALSAARSRPSASSSLGRRRAMFVAVTGPMCSGKKTLARYLVERHGFEPVVLLPKAEEEEESCSAGGSQDGADETGSHARGLRPATDHAPGEFGGICCAPANVFSSFPALLDHVTARWQTNHVAWTLQDKADLLRAKSELVIVNHHDHIGSFHRALDHLDVTNPERLRPSWDT